MPPFAFGGDLMQIDVFLFYLAVPAIFLVAALKDLLRHSFRESNTKLILAMLVIFVPVLGPVFYYVVGKKLP